MPQELTALKPKSSSLPSCGALPELRRLADLTGEDAPASLAAWAPGATEPPRPSRAGFRVERFVEGFVRTPAGDVPRVATRLALRDRLGALAVRLGPGRGAYRVASGLYALGSPTPQSPVLVTANYKLTFDHVRRSLAGTDAWLLVLDTKGVNVWCAAGKKTFSTAELARRVASERLAEVVSHRTLVLPQLSAPGVSAREALRLTGFRVVFGPVRAADLPAFLAAGMRTDAAMRRVDFPLAERLVVSLVEPWNARRHALKAAAACFLLGGAGQDLFSLGRALHHGPGAFLALATGFAAGTFAVPAFLPWLPGRSFALKGAIAGLLAGLAAALPLREAMGPLHAGAFALASTVVGSYFGMNFTGSTPFTSPSGVEREMRRAIPLQAAGAVAAATLWLAGRLA